MNRKEFIQITTKAILGLVIINPLLLRCTTKELDLTNILGKDKNALKNLKIEYVGEISCYSTDKFTHSIEGQKLFIFCIKNKVVGFSVKIENKSIISKIVNQKKNAHIIFDNAFGIREYLREKDTFKSLCISKNYMNIDYKIFYSEYLEEASSFIW